MVDWALYVDESGSPERLDLPVAKGQTPVFTLAGVALPLDRWRDYDRDYLRLKTQFFRKEIDQSSKTHHTWEVKGNYLFAPRNAGSDRNSVFSHRVLDLIQHYNGAIIAVSFIKDHKRNTSAKSLYTKGLQILSERFDIFLRENNSRGIMIVDSRMAHMNPGQGVDYTVAQSYLSFVFGNEEGQQLKRLSEAPLFADSAITAGIQIADIVAALVYANNYQLKISPEGGDPSQGILDYRHVRRFWPRLNETQFQSEKEYQGRTIYGLRTVDHRS